jgi:hypothetical protein
MKIYGPLLVLVAFLSLPAHAACDTFREAMDVVAKQVAEASPQHGPIAMVESCGVANSCTAGYKYVIIAFYDDDRGKRAMHCRFITPKSCDIEACSIDYATTYP